MIRGGLTESLLGWRKYRKQRPHRHHRNVLHLILGRERCVCHHPVQDHFVITVCGTKRAESQRVKYWEIIADNLHAAGWSLGWVSALDVERRTIWIVDAHGYGKRFIVHADEMLTAFLELQRAIHTFAVSLIS